MYQLRIFESDNEITPVGLLRFSTRDDMYEVVTFLLENNENNNNEQPKTKENEGMSYENLDPMGILMQLTAKSEEISKKINKIEALQDNRIEFDKTLKDLQSEVKNL